MDTRCHIAMLGGLRVQQEQRVITHFRTQKTGALLAYLAYHPRAAHPREVLIDLLWPECSPAAGRQNLSVALTSLRHELEPPGVAEGAVIVADRFTVQLNPAAITTDVGAFEAALRAAAKAESEVQRRPHLELAVELYTGELLPGFYQDWVLREKERLAHLYSQAVRGLIESLERAEEWERALEYARRGVGFDPLREEARYDLIRLLAAAGQPGAALRQYEEWERVLQEEMETGPAPALRQLAQEIRNTLHPEGEAPPLPEAPEAEGKLTSAPLFPPDSPRPAPRPQGETDRAGPRTVQVSRFGGRSEPPQVALLSQPQAQPDEVLLKLLETQLREQGCRVFVDRPAGVGLEWAAEFQRQVGASDMVVPLLSETSIHSEMLAYEVEIAYQAAQTQQGRPRLLPVRVNYAGPLPFPSALARILEPLPYVLWQSDQDDARLVEQIIRALQRPSPPLPEHPPSEPVGGALPLDSAFYIVRPTDEEFMAALGRRDCIVLVKGAGQMGKTSLLARGLQQAREAGDQVVLTDFQMFSPAHLTSGKALALTLAAGIADQLELPVLPEAVWSEHRSATVNLERYLRREVLGPLSARLVWGLDEVDRLFPYSSANEVFGLFRSWHNRRALDPAGPWSRLTLALAYATEAHLFIADLNLSPFNVGTQVALEDFTPEQVEELNRRYQAPLRSAEEVERFYRLVNGQPHLVRRGLSELVKPGMDWATLEAQADGEEGPFGDHLRHLLVSLSRDAALTDIVRGLLRGEPCPTSESFYRLRSAGVIKGHSGSDFQFRCPLYQTYLERHLLGTSTGSSPTA